MRINFALAATSLSLLAPLVGCGDGRPRAPMTDGERMYEARCTGCHAAYEPRSRTPDEWVAAVAKMERWKKVTLTDEQRALILSYLSGREKSLPPGYTVPPPG